MELCDDAEEKIGEYAIFQTRRLEKRHFPPRFLKGKAARAISLSLFEIEHGSL